MEFSFSPISQPSTGKTKISSPESSPFFTNIQGVSDKSNYRVTSETIRITNLFKKLPYALYLSLMRCRETF